MSSSRRKRPPSPPPFDRRLRGRSPPPLRHRHHHRRSRSRSRSPPPPPPPPIAPPAAKRAPSFPSYLDVPDLPPKIRLLSEILSSAPSAAAVEPLLDDTGLRVTSSDVEQVLRLAYARPGAALAFFRWAGGRHLAHRHSPYSWNLVVDILGKNCLFDAMWDSVRSMRSEGLLSVATFASVFSSLAESPASDPFTAFLAMPNFGIPQDSAALNSLLSALCRSGRAEDARNALPRAITAAGTRPDADSFAILLEGCENDKDPRSACLVFDEMVAALGWNPENSAAYDSFLVTLLSVGDADKPEIGLDEAMNYLEIMRRNGCLPGDKFFRAALTACVEARDGKTAMALWNEFVLVRGFPPDACTYQSMIALQCFMGNTEAAGSFLDEMVYNGVFPDAKTYNMFLQSLLKGRKLKESAAIFMEMVKNECWPSEGNCALALRMYMDTGNWEMGVQVWEAMVANVLPPLEENGNMLVLKLREMDRLPEACKYAEDMIDRGIKLSSSTLAKLKKSLMTVKKGNIHDHLLRKWKSH